jgi:hypothetical protein
MIQARVFNILSPTILLAAIALQVLCVVENASAVLLAHESFNYGMDTGLLGKSGGTGYSF